MDERLTLAASLYTPGEWGADIGTDHGWLPCAVLEQGISSSMIVSDISAKALRNAEKEAARRGLAARCVFRVADGFRAVDRPVACVSVTGMGGKTIAAMLERGADRVAGADLVISAHTDHELVRRTITASGRFIAAERLCRAAGRLYIVWKAKPGAAEPLADDEYALGTPLLFEEPAELLQPYLRRRLAVLQDALAGIRAAHEDRPAFAETLERRIELLKEKITC